MNRQLDVEADSSVITPVHRSRQRQSSTHDPMKSLAIRVSTKLDEGDFKGAVRLASSDVKLATFEALKEKHPTLHPDSAFPPLPEDIIKAIRSFPNGSAGGPDGLRPQHLKDMIAPPDDNDYRNTLLHALSSFIELVLAGGTPSSIRHYFFGANLTALQKKDGGVRPIAVGFTLRRLTAKVAGNKLMEEMGELLAPRQLGYGVKGGVEAAVHAARLYLRDFDLLRQ